MGRRPTAVTTALRDQIVATLRDRPTPITTDQVVALAHPSFCVHDGGQCTYLNSPMNRGRATCPGHCWKQRIYNSLRALQRAGVVTCHRPRDTYSVYWSAASEPTDAEMNAILAALEGDTE
ncbi:hypothetical protein [Mycobacterium sp. PSTR-4-N]|uniref:hypothetical protein n=1 Tax=Mycobacterium sp. PSTR-4-N TaxID=2917745 RepID=UPI001F1545B5|nr:hypothetical protein [Mycobacterium sp. PSTR-4-N]MCG7592421.1 hypothetical protein [Mycobacterium sp. PSTR-4-N]